MNKPGKPEESDGQNIKVGRVLATITNRTHRLRSDVKQ